MFAESFYKALPYLRGGFLLIELAFGIVRMILYFQQDDRLTNSSNYTSTTANRTWEVILRKSPQSSAAFTLDWIGSIVTTLMGVYVIIFLLFISFCGCTCARLRNVFFNKANHRFITLTCNFPCYKARPQLRFQVRLALMSFFIVLRLLAILLYATDRKTGDSGTVMASVCAISIVFVVFVICLDYYQYRVWWYYRPDAATNRFRCCCCDVPLDPRHERFIPAPLLVTNRKVDEMGNQPCRYTTTGHCPTLSLEHIVIFHAFDYIPQRRYVQGSDLTYIAFHRTGPEGAAGIARGGFRISDRPPQMLGFGVYFARSVEATRRKARHEGALICARINLGPRVLRITHDEIHQVRNSNAWWDDFDSVYYAHEQEHLDEFCLSDPSQVLKWIIVMDDERIRRYGLDREFSDTLFGCI